MSRLYTPNPRAPVFLGRAVLASNNVTVGPLTWAAGTYERFDVSYHIEGYTGSAVARILFGSGSLSTTALTNGSSLSEGVAAATSAPSIPGCPMASTSTTAMTRSGFMRVGGKSGKFKRYNVEGSEGNSSVSVPPTLFRASGCFSDLGTNLLLDRMQMTSYDNLTAAAASGSIVMTTGSWLEVWGYPP